jgi:transcriptional regulator with XRE-family HTH domain
MQMFNTWLLEKLKEKDWSQADLARRSGLTRGAVSNYVNGRTPDEQSLRKIAKAFSVPPENVFRAAGLLPKSSSDPWTDELIYKIQQLDPSAKKMIEKFLQVLLDEQDSKKHTNT